MPRDAVDPKWAVFAGHGSARARTAVAGTSTRPERIHLDLEYPVNTCTGCDTAWTGTSRCHCSGCHQTFSGIVLFDKHRSLIGEHGRCTPPAQIRYQTGSRTGETVMELRNGIWSYPEMTDEAKTARFGSVA